MRAYTLTLSVLLVLTLVGFAGCNKDRTDEVYNVTASNAQQPGTSETTTPAEPGPGTTTDMPVGATAGKTYEIVADDSSIDWEGSKVTETHIGGFADFTGTVVVPDGSLEKLTVEVAVVMDSLYSDAGGLTEVMKDPKFFDVKTHPMSTFKSTGVTKGTEPDQYMVSGDFTLNGVTKNITFPTTVKLDGDTLTASSEFAVNRLDWNVVYQGVGDSFIYDKALIRFDVVSKEKKAE